MTELTAREHQTHTEIVSGLKQASQVLARLSDEIAGTWRHVEGCAKSTTRLAEEMARLEVDRDTIAEHHEAASLMHKAHNESKALRTTAAELSDMFRQAAQIHAREYGAIAATAAAMRTDMANARFYGNR